MAVNHLDDQQVQMYLDHNLQTDKSDIESHVSICEDCRQKLKEYKEVYQVLQEDPYPQLSSNFSRNIMEKLHIKNTFWALWISYLCCDCCPDDMVQTMGCFERHFCCIG